MTQKTLLEQYAEELMKANERTSRKNTGKKPQGAHGGPCGFFKKEWSDQDKMVLRVKVDELIDEFRGVARITGEASRDHQANIIFRGHFKSQVPDEIWEYMMDTVGRAQEMNADEDEMWRGFYENRLRTCGPGDCHVHVYYVPRGRKARKAYATGYEDASSLNDIGNTVRSGERVYTCGGRRHYIVGGCYTRIPEGDELQGDSSRRYTSCTPVPGGE
jgi:hypothetical protein